MNLPFSVEEFLEVFRRYNHAVFPAQVVLFLLAIAIIVVAVWKKPWSGKVVSAGLTGLWVWMGIVYHWIFFTEINKAAWVFGGLFLVQGILFFKKGFLQNTLVFSFTNSPAGWLGTVLITYALLIYPLLGHFWGHDYPASPTFGLPCPTTIFTLGILLWLQSRPPFYLLTIPLLWSVIGTMAAVTLEIREDFGLPVSAATALWVWFKQGNRA